ncbi:MAG TPA: DNA cytosine methyltransferase [Planctomycetota bacterium]|nr:DNA cytosine methyltransferase [Planctomycetota bacterium]
MNELALFAGAGGGILGGILLGWRTVCAVEIDEHCRKVLMQRQDDGILKPFPIWDDITTFDGRPWRGIVDVVSGGFPCQDISAAGKGAGIGGERSGLWQHMARIVGEVRPRYVLVENSPLLVSRGLDVVLADHASLGFDAEWGVVGADDAGAPQIRERLWIVADAEEPRLEGHRHGAAEQNGRTEQGHPRAAGGKMDHTHGVEQGHIERPGPTGWWLQDPAVGCGRSGRARSAKSRLGRVAYGVADRLDRIKALGEGQVPAVVRLAWNILMDQKAKEQCDD